MSKREALLSALAQLRVAHPALPQLRDFQVSPGPLQAVCIQQQQYVFNTMSSVGYTAECFGSRWSKPYPLRSAYGLWEDHAHAAAGPPFASRCWNSNLGNPMLFKNVSGSVTMILVPLITIELQLLEDCKRLHQRLVVWQIGEKTYLTYLTYSVFDFFSSEILKCPVFNVFGVFTYLTFFHPNFEVPRI